MKACQLLPFSKTLLPDAVTLSVYGVWFVSAEVMLMRFSSTISKWSESALLPMPYVGEWPSSTSFCTEIPPTIPGTSDLRIEVLLATTYHFPRFWLKVVAPSNMKDMLVTFETFQPEMSPLKVVAPSNHGVHAGHFRDVPGRDIPLE